MRNRATRILLTAVSLAIVLSGCAKSGAAVPVLSVSEILGIGPIGMVNRFAGVVEAGETVSVNKDSTLQVAEIAVEVGDAVSNGQMLFSYETEALTIEVERMQLEIEQMNNSITTQKSQISTLEKDQKTADSADKLQYTLQIQQIELDIKETEYKIAAKQKEIDQAKIKLADANVLSPASGHIKAINANGETNPQTGEPLPFITIAQEGDYRVRGTVNEQNAGSIAVDMPVIIRSRTDSTLMWSGTIASVDWENPIQSNDSMMYASSDEMTTSSKYPFYVKLNSYDGLMLGQHIYIEPEQGQMFTEDGANGFYLPSYYINDLDSDPWVWAANAKDKLEKRSLTLGNYNIDSDSYEIMEGLELEDFIAYPDENCRAGAPVRYPGELEGDAPNDGAEAVEEGVTDEAGVIDEGGVIDEEGVPTAEGVMPEGGAYGENGAFVDDGYATPADGYGNTLPGDGQNAAAEEPAFDPGFVTVPGTEVTQ